MLDPCDVKIILLGMCLMFITFYFVNQFDNLLGGKNCTLCTDIGNNAQFTNWSISHFLFYILYSALFPEKTTLIITLGIVWELVELFLEYTIQTQKPSFICNITNSCDEVTKVTPAEFWNFWIGKKRKKDGLYFCSSGMLGQIMDILFNIAGVYVGSYIGKKYNINLCNIF